MNPKLRLCTHNSNQTDGRGGVQKVVCLAATPEVAQEIINHEVFYKKHGIMGSKAGCEIRKPLETELALVDRMMLFGSVADYLFYTDAPRVVDLIKSGLAKLTKDERVALGVCAYGTIKSW